MIVYMIAVQLCVGHTAIGVLILIMACHLSLASDLLPRASASELLLHMESQATSRCRRRCQEILSGMPVPEVEFNTFLLLDPQPEAECSNRLRSHLAHGCW